MIRTAIARAAAAKRLNNVFASCSSSSSSSVSPWTGGSKRNKKKELGDPYREQQKSYYATSSSCSSSMVDDVGRAYTSLHVEPEPMLALAYDYVDSWDDDEDDHDHWSSMEEHKAKQVVLDHTTTKNHPDDVQAGTLLFRV
jgi:hypothetical protein